MPCSEEHLHLASHRLRQHTRSTSSRSPAGAERLGWRSEGSPRGEAPAPRAACRAFFFAPGGASRFCLRVADEPHVTCYNLQRYAVGAHAGLHIQDHGGGKITACLCSFGSPSFSSSSPSSSCRSFVHRWFMIRFPRPNKAAQNAKRRTHAEVMHIAPTGRSQCPARLQTRSPKSPTRRPSPPPACMQAGQISGQPDDMCKCLHLALRRHGSCSQNATAQSHVTAENVSEKRFGRGT